MIAVEADTSKPRAYIHKGRTEEIPNHPSQEDPNKYFLRVFTADWAGAHHDVKEKFDTAASACVYAGMNGWAIGNGYKFGIGDVHLTCPSEEREGNEKDV